MTSNLGSFDAAGTVKTSDPSLGCFEADGVDSTGRGKLYAFSVDKSGGISVQALGSAFAAGGNNLALAGYGLIQADGALDGIVLGCFGADPIRIGVNNALKWLFDGTDGHFLPHVDGGVDIGSGAARVGNIHLSGALDHDGTTAGFFGTAPAAKPTVTGSRGGNAALASLLTALAGLGLITDSTTA